MPNWKNIRSYFKHQYVVCFCLLFSFFLYHQSCFAQCKAHFSVKRIDTVGICNDDNGIDTLYVSSKDTLSKIQWFSTVSSDTTIYAVTIPSIEDVKTVAGGNGKGNALNQLSNPSSIFIDKNGYLYASDQNNHRVLKFPPGSTSSTQGVVIAGGNGEGSGSTQFDYPMGLCVDDLGNVYVADFANGRIQKFPPNSNSNTPGITVVKKDLDGPSCVSVDAAGDIFVGDEAGQVILKYPASSNANTDADTLGTNLGYVFTIFAAPNGDLYAALADDYYVIKFPANMQVSVIVAGTGTNGNAQNELSAPISCYLDSEGYLYVLDATTCRVIKFPPGSTKGTAGITVAGGNGVRGGSGINQLFGPTSMFLDASENIYVCDDGNNRVQEYFKDGPTTTFMDSAYGIDIPNLHDTGFIYAIVTNKEGCTDTTNKFTILPLMLPGIVIGSNAANSNLCGQTNLPLIFTATISNGGHHPRYQWRLNGKNTGSNSNTFPGTFSENDIVSCTLTTDIECASADIVKSSDFIVKFHPPPFALLTKIDGGCLSKDSLFINPDIYSIRSVNWNLNNMVDTIYQSRKIVDTGRLSIGITVAGGNDKGNSTNQFYGPNAICLDTQGNLYVADGLNNRVMKFPPGSNSFTNGLIVAGGNGTGNAVNQFSFPSSVFVDKNGNLFVADQHNARIQKFLPNNINGITVAGGNLKGNAANQLFEPTSAITDPDGNIYVCDQLNNRVQKFPANSTGQTDGITVAGGIEGNELNELHGPSSICFDKNNNLIVADFLNQRVLKFPSNSNSSTSGTILVAASQNIEPYSIYIDRENNLYVADTKKNNVFLFPEDSQTGSVVAGIFQRGSANNQFDEPCSVCVDTGQNIFIADLNNSRVQKYSHYISIIDTSFLPLATGVYTATLTDTSGCVYTTNPVTISNTIASVNISSSSNNICFGNYINFIANAVSAGLSPLYQWQINGVNTGVDSSIFKTDSLQNNDVISCIVSNSGCSETDTSNTIVAVIKPVPVFGLSTDITINRGESTMLNIPLQTTVTSYLWSPDYNLSSTTILNPTASPLRTTIYYLQATNSDDCIAKDSIKVNVISKIYIPTAFTPNGDGMNDFFYVIGGLPDDEVEDFIVFNRWGQKQFEQHNQLPNYPNNGWNGKTKDMPALSGTYVYFIKIKSANGKEEIYKGTVVLIR